jgi:hypothetical protein
MIYQSYNFIDSYSNASGNRRDSMVLGELGKVIRENPNAVKSALEDADIKVPRGTNNKGIIRLVMMNKRNPRMIKNLSALIFASASFDGGYEFLGRKKSGNESTDGEAKKGLFKAIGGWFQKRKERKQAQKLEGGAETKDGKEKVGLFKRIGSFFSKNKEEIGTISTSLADSLQNRNAQQTMTTNVNRYKSADAPTQEAGFFAKNKTAIIIGGIAIVLVGGYFLMKRKK